MKRFWKEARAVPGSGGFAVELDGKGVRTPGRNELLLPNQRLGEAVAAEWDAAGEKIDPNSMPLTGFANAAIDRIAPNTDAFAGGLAKYGEADLLCYRADFPPELVERQEREWGPLLAWARRRYDVDFRITAGIMHLPQADATAQRLGHAVASLDPHRLAGLSPLVTIGGSLVAALMVAEEAISPEEAWAAVTLDERWQAEQWGSDEEAEAALEARRQDFLAGARFLELLD